MLAHPFTLDHSAHSGYDLVALLGDLDIHTAPWLNRLVQDPARLTQPTLVLDLTEMQFLDSSGIGALVGAHRSAGARDVTLALVLLPSVHAMQLLQMMRLVEFLNIHPNIATAIDAHVP